MINLQQGSSFKQVPLIKNLIIVKISYFLRNMLTKTKVSGRNQYIIAVEKNRRRQNFPRV